ncbi:MAG TPA: galactokinase [bacterium]|nr:galactokinase [bacterium]
MKKRIEKSFVEIFGGKEDFFSVCTPGRANLIGEHIDYQGGRVMPFAIDRFIFSSGRKRNDSGIRIFSFNYKDSVETSLDKISRQEEKTWSNYLLGVIKEFRKSGFMESGVEIAFGGNIPAGSGLSSSAALEISTASLLQKIFRTSVSPLEMIKLARRAENEFVGVSCGIMDQFSVCLARKNRAVMINCKTLDYEYVPLFLGDNILILVNTMKERKLSSSVYNERVDSVNKALNIIKKSVDIEFLTDLSTEQLNSFRSGIPEALFKRALHIVEENKRVIKASCLLSEKKTDEFGQLMYQSHKSLRELYEVSCDELDFIVHFSENFEGVKGARLTGAGMGGCCIVLIKKAAAKKYRQVLSRDYAGMFGVHPEFYSVKPVNGAFYRGKQGEKFTAC